MCTGNKILESISILSQAVDCLIRAGRNHEADAVIKKMLKMVEKLK